MKDIMEEMLPALSFSWKGGPTTYRSEPSALSPINITLPVLLDLASLLLVGLHVSPVRLPLGGWRRWESADLGITETHFAGVMLLLFKVVTAFLFLLTVG